MRFLFFLPRNVLFNYLFANPTKQSRFPFPVIKLSRRRADATSLLPPTAAPSIISRWWHSLLDLFLLCSWLGILCKGIALATNFSRGVKSKGFLVQYILYADDVPDRPKCYTCCTFCCSYSALIGYEVKTCVFERLLKSYNCDYGSL